MKKAIAAILSMFVGLYGYAIVDEALENRVKNLEYAVSSQEECINSLHRLGDYSMTTDPTENTTSTTTIPTFNGTFRNVGKQTKFMFRLYSNGAIRYVGTFAFEPTDPLYPTSSTSPYLSYLSLSTSPYYYSTRSHQTAPTDTTSITTSTSNISSTTLPDDYEEYFAYITESSAVVTSTEDTSSVLTYYDHNYDVSTSIKYKNKTYTTVTVKGYTDEIFAGKTISMICQIYNCHICCVVKNNGIIASDGTFEIKYIYESSHYPNSNACYEINSLYIF